jgi:hypothetical protein
VSETLTIEGRFNGPEGSGNGGYTCGLLARELDGEAEVTLRRPPPLDRPLVLVRDEGRVACSTATCSSRSAVRAESISTRRRRRASPRRRQLRGAIRASLADVDCAARVTR